MTKRELPDSFWMGGLSANHKEFLNPRGTHPFGVVPLFFIRRCTVEIVELEVVEIEITAAAEWPPILEGCDEEAMLH